MSGDASQELGDETQRATHALAAVVDESPNITLVGLILETASGLRRALSPTVQSEIGAGGQSFELCLRLLRSPGSRLRMTDLAAQTGITPSGLTRAIDRLIAARLVTREVCPDDRRGSYAALTALGVEKTTAATAQHCGEIATLLEGVLSAEETDALSTSLERLRDRVNPEAALVSED